MNRTISTIALFFSVIVSAQYNQPDTEKIISFFPVFTGANYNVGRVLTNNALNDGFSRFRFGRTSFSDIFGQDATKLYFVNASDFEFIPIAEDKAERLTQYLQKTGVNGGYTAYYSVEFEILPIHLYAETATKLSE